MKYVNHPRHMEIIPESLKDVEDLKKEYPQLWPFKSVCVAIKTSYKPILKRRITS